MRLAARSTEHQSTSIFFTDTAPTEIYTLSLHDALPICYVVRQPGDCCNRVVARGGLFAESVDRGRGGAVERSEEHTSELQSQSNLVCRLLLEKKNYFRLLLQK